ncbi:MAG: N-carbamoyl-L-amino-acid hydrolase [Candidatus Poriferisodalaceae bacterium]|jgi:N-carbamoyl-L-amino-acid hydrolase
MSELVVNGDRLLARLAELAQIGAIEGTAGCSRLALTSEDGAGRDLVATWMRGLGMSVTVDGIGNVIATMVGANPGPPVMTGSHIDTVGTGGRYDGNLGVLAGLEVVETLLEAGVTPERDIAVGFFTNEEGARFAPDMLGSLVYVGGLPLEEALEKVAIDDAILREELDAIGYRGVAPSPGPAPHAFVELHIEQGPVLEVEGIRIGAVTGVQGISWTEFTITGQSNHAGTTPIALRHDPGLVAMQIAAHVREIALELGGSQVGTVGKIDLHPNLVNVVAATATITVDLRNTDEATLQEAEARVQTFVAAAAKDEGCTVQQRVLARFEPVDFSVDVIDSVEAAAQRLGHTVTRMPSGAGHDAQMMARVCPTGMVFVPSVGGISHNPAEHTDAADLEAGANVLLHVVLELCSRDLLTTRAVKD